MSTKKRTTTTTTTRVKNANRTRRGPKRRVRAAITAQKTTSAIHVASCTRMYAKALVNPFDVSGLPCIPDNIILPSFKFVTKARGVFSTGTNGIGYIYIDPFQMLCNDGSYNPLTGAMGVPIVYTTTAFAGVNLSVPVAGVPAGVAFANPNSLFGTADFDVTTFANANRQFRLVGCGLRCRYIGSNLYNQGRLTIFRQQGNDSLQPVFGYTSASFLQDNYTSCSPVSRADRYVYYVPDDPQFIAYNAYNGFNPNFVGGVNHHSMGIYIDGGALGGNAQSWEFEAVAFFEVIGKGFTLSRSEGDPVGHDLIMSSLPNVAPTVPPKQIEQGVMSSFVKGFVDTTREVAYNVGRQAVGYAANSAMNYMRTNSNQLYLMPS